MGKIFESIAYVFNPANFEPHGIHFAPTPILFWTLIIANSVTFISYTLIPIQLIHIVRKRKDLPFHWVFLVYGAFIVLCGLHHLVHVITFWHPLYGLQATVDSLMAIVSFSTFLALIPVLPLVLKLPSPDLLREANEKLIKEVAEHKKSLSELSEKKAEVETMNEFLVGRELKLIELEKENEELKKKNKK